MTQFRIKSCHYT